MSDNQNITKETTINEAIKLRPETVAVFSKFKMDSCCGGALPIEEAAKKHGVEAEDILKAIEDCTKK